MDCRVPYASVLTILTLILALVPAIVIWFVFMDLMTTSVDLLRAGTRDSTNSMAHGMQKLMISQATEKLNARLNAGERVLNAEAVALLEGGLRAYDLHPAHFDIPGKVLFPYRTRNFATLKGQEYFSAVGLHGAIWKNTSGSPATVLLFWVQWSALLFDVATGAVGQRTLYHSDLCMLPGEQLTQCNVSYPNQTSGQLLSLVQSSTLPKDHFVGVHGASGWDDDLSFNLYTGQIELTISHGFAAQNDTWLQTVISLNAQTISAELRAQLDRYPDDRLVIFFRETHGHMIAASHGEFFSHSDVDLRSVNVFANPPNVSAYRLWTCLESNDVFIPLACKQLYDTYQSWTAIPEATAEMVLANQRYWVATARPETTHIQVTLLMLKNRETVMGRIDSSNVVVDGQMDSKKGVTFIVFGVVTGVAILLPFGLGLWLSAHFKRMAVEMDQIAQLQFTTGRPSTVFCEVHRFQSSVQQMERGLQAFGKFVPQAVVKVLMAGDMASGDGMANETLTIMFADIEGFTTVCETVSPEVLVEVCTEYFEATCSSIVQAHGTIDKFIGDCIMALWNAPQPLPGHERDAVGAALAMQDSVMQLHGGWQQRGLPILKFRLGIHTGTCLVGNFGCSYRVSYTCLGDGANLAARLEALNKRFGTHICVSHATYEGCRDDFHFRRLARVTVPGKAEVLPVYEVLCPRAGTRPPVPPNTANNLPGHVPTSPTATHPQCIEGLLPYRIDDTRQPDRVPYHWQDVDLEALLGQAGQYEAAYEAMVQGDLASAQLLLADPAALAIPDKAWLLLTDQLQQLNASAELWDGVFYFREK